MGTNNSWNSTVQNQNITLNSGNGGTVGISTDNAASTVNIATGAGAKTVTCGSIANASSLALKYGTNNFSLASATGNLITASAAGIVQYPLQPRFDAYLSAAINNITGDGTAYTIIWDSTRANFGACYDAATGVFTAPFTAKYLIYNTVYHTSVQATNTLGEFIQITTPVNLLGCIENMGVARQSTGEIYINSLHYIALTAGDTCYVVTKLSNGTKVVDISNTWPAFDVYMHF